MMNQQHDFPPPPPPSTSAVYAPSHPSGQAPQRPSIATNIVRAFGGSSQTPASGTSYTPFNISPNTPTTFTPRTPSALGPHSAVSPRTQGMEPYDPRQWSGRGQVSGAQMVFQQRASAGQMGTREATGMEGLYYLIIGTTHDSQTLHEIQSSTDGSMNSCNAFSSTTI